LPYLGASKRFGGLQAAAGGFFAELPDMLAQDLMLLTRQRLGTWPTGGALPVWPSRGVQRRRLVARHFAGHQPRTRHYRHLQFTPSVRVGVQAYLDFTRQPNG